MKKLLIAVGLGTCGLVAAPTAAFAQDAGSAETTYDFEDDLVTGDLVRPDGEMLNVRRRGRRASLIRVREHFIPEMLKSVENL
ncbi:MAG TPA: hypothetical protein RMH99_26260 [Sandaracinaceae bacterium LLY-WYZ-13_1]|nr:hypothetical protein [Sandaracinaceae bacterium LLY-WYZ-13_1]